ncbi:melatonin receptor type 1C-like [Coregonus clupeaformis]|uniref:melatonin receptor type 1C-like n=1 Tax=Coregonus clupeaformis TaxID=59861 RepID=UPI001E1C8BC4|nr:melatonin receptor type 1C-like [Coregonus clupeaformis]
MIVLSLVGNIFVVSMSVEDTVVAVYPYPLAILSIFHNDWIVGDMHCQLSGFIMGLSVIGSVFNILAISINRYCYICHSLHYDRMFSTRNTCCYLGLNWLLTAMATVPNFFVDSLQYDPHLYSCTFAQTASSY